MSVVRGGEPAVPLARRQEAGGYILLLSLIVAGLGMGAAALAFAVAQVGARVETADARHELAGTIAEGALRDVIDQLVWGRLPAAWRGEAVSRSVDGLSGATTMVRVQPTGRDGDARGFVMEATGVHKGATADRCVEIRVVPGRLPGGLTCAGDLRAEATLWLIGCGAYVGGDVYGREHIRFPEGEPPDTVRGVEWPVAAVHAGGRIYAAGREVHEAGTATPHDTDSCVATGVGPVAAWPPDGEWWASVAGNAEVHPFMTGETFELGALAATIAGRSFPSPATGPVVLLDPSSGEACVAGRWPLDGDEPQATLVVRGDCVVGETPRDTDAVVLLRGSLLVDGTLTVRAPTLILGFVAARDLRVEAPLRVVVESEWRVTPPPGSWTAVIASTVESEAASISTPNRCGRWPVGGRRMRSRGTERVSRGRRRRHGGGMSATRLHDMNDVARPDNVLVPGRGNRSSVGRRHAREHGECLKPSFRVADDTAGVTRGLGVRGV